jgi:hypothetical protein
MDIHLEKMNPKYFVDQEKCRNASNRDLSYGPALLSEKTTTTSNLYLRASGRYLALYSSPSNKFALIASIESH